VRFLRSKRGVAVLSVVLLLILFLVRPGVGRLRARIVSSISLALGRPVDVAAVNLRFLPQPGFDLEGFVVHDDPAFGAEPMLRADQVTASLRMISLLRGRLEIARLSLTEPSLNLVRNGEGHWNLENLLERAAKTPVAPTGKPKTEPRPGFPYIEAVRGRINFKFGVEKKPYAVTDANFAVWQDSENAWGMRLRAIPVRTDSSLSDTGTIRVNGSWQRAAILRDTPLQFSFLWEHAQLGQLTKLVSGNDKGWRGTAQLSATLTGTPARLDVETKASVDDFRRYDILGGGDLLLAAQCRAQYSSVNHTFAKLDCKAPLGDGSVSLAGTVVSPLGARSFDLVLAAQQVPAQSLATFARHTKKDIPDDLIASGHLDARLQLRKELSKKTKTGNMADLWQGVGEANGVHVVSRFTNTDLTIERIPLAFSAEAPAKLRSGLPAHVMAKAEVPAHEPHLGIGPFSVPLGKAPPALMYGWISHSGYGFAIQGEAQLQRLLQAARTVGLAAPQPTADGAARVDLQIAGTWAGLIAPRAVGTAQLHSVRTEVRGWNVPLEIDSANLLLSQDQVQVKNLAASVAGSEWHGSLVLPRPCLAPALCAAHFDLHANEIAADQLNLTLNPGVRKQPWYHFLSPSAAPGKPYLLAVRAAGTISADRLLIRKLTATHVSADARLENGLLQLSDLRGDVLGGKHVGDWKADFTHKPPQYSGSGTLDQVALGQLSQVMNDGWITGTANGSYRITTSGLSMAELLSSAAGNLQVEAHDGLLPHIALADGSGPLEMNRLKLRLALAQGKFAIEEGKLETPAGAYQVNGSASFDRSLNVKLAREGGHGFNITGTLSKPVVSPSTNADTQASLKP
jgi:AsmA-like C-terminal region/AsmA family